jgi:hypothetical protein
MQQKKKQTPAPGGAVFMYGTAGAFLFPGESRNVYIFRGFIPQNDTPWLHSAAMMKKGVPFGETGPIDHYKTEV